MSFTSVYFIPYMVIAFAVYHSAKIKHKHIVILALNVAFCVLVNPKMVLALATVILVTYLGGIIIYKSGNHKRTLIVFISCSVLILLGFRSYSGLKYNPAVVGVSFYSLQAIGYLIDVYMRRTDPERNLIKYADYISFFPTVISGPIQRSTNLLQQIQDGTTFSYDLAKSGLRIMAGGYFAKILVADRINPLIAPIFDSIETQSGTTLLFGLIMYGIELYADFSGYSLIAIGTARLLGFEIGDNFRQPYFAIGISDFWRRWHISLSTWLRDYIYIPLGGNRKGKTRKIVNLLITFLISGIWHGSGLNYVIWGVLHGLYSAIESVAAYREQKVTVRRSKTKMVIRGLVTFIIVNFGWLFFRVDSPGDAVVFCKRVVCNLDFVETVRSMTFLSGYNVGRFAILLVEILILFGADVARETGHSVCSLIDRRSALFRMAVYVIVTVILIMGAFRNYGLDSSAFIYAQF